MQARLASLQADKDAAQAEVKALAAKAEDQAADIKKLKAHNAKLEKTAKEEAAKNSPVTFEVEEDAENGIEGGEYEFTAPTLHWDDNSIVVVRELANSKDVKDQERYATICAELVARKSGLVRRKED